MTCHNIMHTFYQVFATAVMISYDFAFFRVDGTAFLGSFSKSKINARHKSKSCVIIW